MRETHQYAVMHYGEVSIKGKNRPTFCAAWSGTRSKRWMIWVTLA
jgi:hypothetical protein